MQTNEDVSLKIICKERMFVVEWKRGLIERL